MEETIVAPIAPPVVEKLEEYRGIPIECFQSFYIPIDKVSGEEIGHLKDIVEWAKSQSPDKFMDKIKSLRMQLGTPNTNERAYDRVWRFVKMQKCINAVRG